MSNHCSLMIQGIGKIHSKFSPVCTACLQYQPDIQLNHELLEQLTPEEKESFVSKCQPGVFEYRAETEQVSFRNVDVNGSSYNRCVSFLMNNRRWWLPIRWRLIILTKFRRLE